MLARITHTLVDQRRDRRQHADRLPLRRTAAGHAAEANFLASPPMTLGPQFAAKVARRPLPLSGLSWLYPLCSYP
jgi:hypothetical protein